MNTKLHLVLAVLMLASLNALASEWPEAGSSSGHGGLSQTWPGLYNY